MPQSSRSSVNLGVTLESQRASRPVEPDEPFRILVLGDFTGRGNRSVRSPMAGRRPALVDRDNIDEVLADLRPSLTVRGAKMNFGEVGDFHPDQLYRKIPVFAEIEEGRFKPVAAAAPAETEAAAGGVPTRNPAGGGLLDQMMEDADDVPAAATAPMDDLAAFIARVTAKDLAPREDPTKKQRQAEAATLAGAAMRAILHDPDFQALEAGWLALDLMVRRTETGEDLKLYLLDTTRDELLEDVEGTRKLFASPEKPWSLIVANYGFGETARDAERLSFFGALAEQSGIPFLAEAAPPAAEQVEEWRKLRRSSRARYIGLALPRFLLRLPYGRDTSPIDSFPFEEMPASVHQDYVWGNPAFACACLLAQSFSEEHWDMRPGTHRKVSGLPVHVYTEDGESVMKPCAEVLMTETEAEFLLERGIMPLASLKGQDSAVLVRFQSIADPIAPLSGRWGPA